MRSDPGLMDEPDAFQEPCVCGGSSLWGPIRGSNAGRVAPAGLYACRAPLEIKGLSIRGSSTNVAQNRFWIPFNREIAERHDANRMIPFDNRETPDIFLSHEA
jgi:hypothetical protein